MTKGPICIGNFIRYDSIYSKLKSILSLIILNIAVMNVLL